MPESKSNESHSDKPVYMTLIKDGKLTHKTYTLEEAQNAGVFNPHAYSFLDNGEPNERLAGSICPHCGYVQRDFERSGRLGCARCIETFKPLVMPLIERMHKGTTHKGKVPTHLNKRITLESQLKHLTQELQQSIKDERYEDAAQFRDKINTIEEQLEGIE